MPFAGGMPGAFVAGHRSQTIEKLVEDLTVQALRSVGSVVLGYLVFALSAAAFFLLTGQPPHAPAPLSIMFGCIAVGIASAFLGGYLAARLAGRHPSAHGLAVALILALAATISLVSTVGHGAIWSQVAALVLMAPAAAVGGVARSRRV